MNPPKCLEDDPFRLKMPVSRGHVSFRGCNCDASQVETNRTLAILEKLLNMHYNLRVFWKVGKIPKSSTTIQQGAQNNPNGNGDNS